jgi:hypothetical protein
MERIEHPSRRGRVGFDASDGHVSAKSRHGPTYRIWLAGGLASALVLATAGCGESGDGDEQSRAEAWAGDVCSAVGSWRTEVTAASQTLGDTGNLSANEANEAFDNLATATEDLVSELVDIGPPDTDAGDEAEERIDALSDQLEAQRDIIRDATENDAGTVNEVLEQVSRVTGAVSTMITDALRTVDQIRNLDGAEELEGAFASASTCQDLRSSPSPTDK